MGVGLGSGWSTGSGFNVPGRRVLKFQVIEDGGMVRVRVVGVRVHRTRVGVRVGVVDRVRVQRSRA